jgi:hypothetical protein
MSRQDPEHLILLSLTATNLALIGNDLPFSRGWVNIESKLSPFYSHRKLISLQSHSGKIMRQNRLLVMALTAYSAQL